jgi:hypothetical protein
MMNFGSKSLPFVIQNSPFIVFINVALRLLKQPVNMAFITR